MSAPKPTQRFSLATPTLEFDSKTLRKLLYSAKSFQELAPVKKYLISYFARGEVGVYKWQPKKRTFRHFSIKDACDSFIQSDAVEFKNAEGVVIGRFDIQTWFFRDTPFFTLEVNPSQPKIYREVDGGYYINQFLGFLHPNPPPFHEFSQEIRDLVKLILNHMTEVLSSSDKKQSYYMKNLVMRIAVGQKMQKTMFLYSGPGTGKTMLTWFLRMMVLGPAITTKTANEKIITGQFNKELEGKCLLVLEEMSNSKSADWITFANRLKDFVDSDTLMIEEKHKTAYPVTNITNLIISSNNSKTIRLDRDDRRYFIPDISEKYVENGIGMDHYYAPLDKAIKNPEVGKAFYSYALEYVRLNPDFDERKIPMTKTKLMMINRDSNIVHEFIKQEFVCNSMNIDTSSSLLYSQFKGWCSTQLISNSKKPPTVQEFTRTLGGLGLVAKRKRVGDRKNDKKMQWYSASYKDLYTVFLKRNMIDEAENLDEPEGYQHKENAYIPPAEILPEKPNLILQTSSQPEKIDEPEPDSPRVAPKKVPPPLPPKSEGIKAKVKSLKSKSSNSEPYGIPGPSNTSAQEIVVEQQDAQDEINPASIPLPESPKLAPIKEPPKQLNPEEVRLAKQKARKEAKELKELEQANLDRAMKLAETPLLSKEEMIDGMYNKAEKYYAKYMDDLDECEFDWVCLNEEIKARANGSIVKSPTNTWEALLDDMVMHFRKWYNAINGNKESHIYPTNEEIAYILEKYHKEGELEFAPPPEGFKTIKVESIVEKPSLIDERDCALANGEEESWSDIAEDEWYDQLANA